MKRYLFVDGYNIINGWDELKSIADGISLEEARNRLIDILSDYKSYTDQNIYLVFDAHQVKGLSDREDFRVGIHIIYTKENQTADSYIEVRVSQLAKNRQNIVRVATSDKAEQQMILGSGGSRISGREFYMEIKESNQKINKKTNVINNEKYRLWETLEEDIAQKLEELRKKQE
jgi:predicted RNA-binding protein with PIN domain